MTPPDITLRELLLLIAMKIDISGGMVNFCQLHHLAPAQLTAVLDEIYAPDWTILNALGYEPVTYYRKRRNL